MSTARRNTTRRPHDGPTEWLTLQQAAVYIAASTKTVRRRIADRQLQAYVCGKRGIRIRRDDLDNLMKPISNSLADVGPGWHPQALRELGKDGR